MVLKLKEYCRKNGIALAEVSRRCGISRVSLSRYAHGVQSMTLDQLSKIVSALGCRVEDLVDDREDLKSREWGKVIRSALKKSSPNEDKSWVPMAVLSMLKIRDHVSPS